MLRCGETEHWASDCKLKRPLNATNRPRQDSDVDIETDKFLNACLNVANVAQVFPNGSCKKDKPQESGRLDFAPATLSKTIVHELKDMLGHGFDIDGSTSELQKSFDWASSSSELLPLMSKPSQRFASERHIRKTCSCLSA